MPASTVFAGLDLTDVAIRAALWDPASRRSRLVDQGAGDVRQAFDVGLQERRAAGGRTLHPVFPPPPDWEPDADALLFRAVRHHLPAFRDSFVDSASALQQAVLQPALRYLRSRIGDGPVQASIAVPLEYVTEHCAALESAAREAGFSAARTIAEPIAAVLAYLPEWREQGSAWADLAIGQSVWVIESGYWDLFLALVHLRQQPTTAGHRLEFTLLAGDCIDNFGVMGQGCDEALLERELRQSAARMLSAALEQPSPAAGGQPPSSSRATWIVASGESPALATAVGCLRSILSGPVWSGAQSLPSIMAAGAAVHAAIAGEQLPYRIAIERRAVLGVTVHGNRASAFEPIAAVWEAVPAGFERAFLVPAGPPDAPIEITFAAAVPGGSRYASLNTFVLPQAAVSAPDRVVIVDGRLETAAGGHVGVLDGRTGKRLAQAEFRLV